MHVEHGLGWPFRGGYHSYRDTTWQAVAIVGNGTVELLLLSGAATTRGVLLCRSFHFALLLFFFAGDQSAPGYFGATGIGRHMAPPAGCNYGT